MNSFAARLVGVLRRPRATFATIASSPTWASALVFTTAVVFVCGAAFLATEVGRLALVNQWERTTLAFGQPIDDAQYTRMQETASSDGFGVAYAAVTALASGPVLSFVLAALLQLVLNRTTGRRASYSQVLAIVCYAGVILALRQIVTTPIDYARESFASPTTAVQLFSMLDETSPIARFLGAIDLFVVWWIIVVAIGMSALYARPARRFVLAFAGAYVALALLAALAMAATGGTT